MRELLVLRHGLSVANERRVFSGAEDVPLSVQGIAALRAARERYPAAQRFFTSGMLRARQTLEALYGDVASTEISQLAEYNLGAFEGRSHEDLFEAEPLYRAWLSSDAPDVACPGGESRKAFERRVLRGWGVLMDAAWEGLAVLVSHGGVLATIMRLGVPFGMGFSPPDNGSGWRLALSEHGAIERYEAFP